MSGKTIVSRGLIAGLIGATILAIWFSIFDALQGHPLYTAAFLSRTLAHVEGVEKSLAMIGVYSLLHYTAFLVVGVAVATLMARLEACPSLLLGAILGFVLFDVVFYLGVALTGLNVVAELGWPQVLSGSVLAGMSIMVYLQLAMGIRSPSWVGALARHRIVREGILVGAIGATVVAVWFFIIDLIRGEVLFTPGALGSAVLLRVASATQVEISSFTVGGYSIIHFGAFVFVGLAAAALVAQAEKFPAILLAGFLIFATSIAFFLGMLAVFAEWVLGAIGWLSVGIGTLLATSAMAYYLWRVHPELQTIFKLESPVDEEHDTTPPR